MEKSLKFFLELAAGNPEPVRYSFKQDLTLSSQQEPIKCEHQISWSDGEPMRARGQS